MDLTEIGTFNEVSTKTHSDNQVEDCISLETEMPEALYQEMNDFVISNPNWDQYKVMSSAFRRRQPYLWTQIVYTDNIS